MKNTSFINNSALYGGAIYYKYEGVLKDSNPTYFSNKAQMYGDNVASYPIMFSYKNFTKIG
jgi:hypothetical protein